MEKTMCREKESMLENEECQKYILRSGSQHFSELFGCLIRASYGVRCYLANGAASWFLSPAYVLTVDEFEKKFGPIEQTWTETEVTKALACTVVTGPMEGEGDYSYEYGTCSIDIDNGKVDYRVYFYDSRYDEYDVEEELNFGWEHSISDPDECDDGYTLTIYCMAIKGSSLERALIENGFYLESSVESLKKQALKNSELFLKAFPHNLSENQIGFADFACSYKLNAYNLIDYLPVNDLDALSDCEYWNSEGYKNFVAILRSENGWYSVLFYCENKQWKQFTSEKEVREGIPYKNYADMVINWIRKEELNFDE